MSLIHIDSKNRIAGGSFYDFYVAVDAPKNNVTRCTLSDFVMPQTAPNILAPDNVFYYTESVASVDTDKSITFPEGQYDLCAFMDMYKQLMDANTTYTFTDSCYNTETLSYNPYIGFTAPATTDPASPSWIIQWSRMPKLAYLLGYEPTDTVLGRNTIWSSFAYNFSPDNFLHLSLSPSFPQCTGTINNESITVPSTFPISLYANGGIVSKFDQRLCIDVGPGLFRDKMLHVRLFKRDGTYLKIKSDWGFTLIIG